MSYKYLGHQPYNHQLKTINYWLENKRGYDFSDLGSGKTNSALWSSDMLFEAQKIKSVLILCPLSIIEAVWVEAIRTEMPNRIYSIVHGTRDKRIAALNKPADFYIANHDATRTYWMELLDKNFDIVIIDEVDAYKNPNSKRSKGAQKITATVKGCFGLTGTPMANSPMEAFGIAKVVNPNNMPTKYITNWRRMTMVQFGEFIWEPNERAEYLVHDMLQPAIRHKLTDCVDIPDITYEYREFKMEPKQAKYYKEMYKHQLIELSNGDIVASTAAVKFTKLLQITAGAVYDEQGNTVILNTKSKVEEVKKIQNEVGQLIIFVQFVEVIKNLKDQLDSAEVLYGDVPRKRRAEILNDFKEGKFNILIAQPRIAAHGLNLQFCNHIIFWGPILGNSYFRQAIGRIRRAGQKFKQVIICFFSSSAEKKLYKTLETKEVSSNLLLSLYEEGV